MQAGVDTTAPVSVSNKKRERQVVWLCALLAIVHVILYSAAFPLFDNVDEQEHFDMVIKYSHGHVPRSMELPLQETMQYLVIYDSQEYVAPPGAVIPPPPWKNPPATTDLQAWEKKLWPGANYESSQPPLYYVVGSLWWKLGRALGMDGGPLVYWLRFLNGILVAALVWLGFIIARTVCPENRFIQWSVPAMIAFLPQTAFYSIDNDMLSPLAFGMAFLALIRFWQAETPATPLGCLVGLSLGLTWLVKISNLPLLVTALAFVLVKIIFLARARKAKAAAPAIIALFVFAALPTGIWMARMKQTFGDVTGSAAKVQFLTWTVKPLGDWWHHPIFSPAGAWTFLSEVLGNLWQGEFWWHHQPMTLPVINAIYTVLTVGLIAIAVLNIRQARQPGPLWFAFAIVIAGISFLALLSVVYDFHDCPNPSRDHPYFNQARLLLGMLVPFLLLLVCGIDRALDRFGTRGKFLGLAVLLACMVTFELVTNRPAIFNEYNWFHM